MAGTHSVITREKTFLFDGRAASTQETPIGPEIETAGWGSGLLEVRFYGVAGTVWDAASRVSIVVRNVDSSDDAPLPAYSAEVCVLRLGAASAGTLAVAALPDRLPIGTRVQAFLRWEQGPNTNPQGGPVAAVLGIDLVGNSASRIIPSAAAGLALWLRGDVVTINGSGKVTTWRDLSGQGRDATTPVNSTSPTWTETPSTTFNRRSVVTFLGSTDEMSTPALPIATFTIFSVFNQTGAAGIVYEQGPDTNVSNGCYLYGNVTDTIMTKRASAGPATGKNLTTNWATDGVPRIVRHEYGGTHASHLMMINGVQQSLSDVNVGDPGTAAATNAIFLGSRSGNIVPMTGSIAEFVIFTPQLPPGLARALELQYFGPRYGVSV